MDVIYQLCYFKGSTVRKKGSDYHKKTTPASSKALGLYLRREPAVSSR
ncbi:6991_t:CDS:2 [Ambispora leptoticha]|uniref:6991_t:CDS:1 n=1 Tax=Ambispora leptoticha TaxID=144679 RepID=A0A9N9F5W0_9GLOM|nr:6991_t:CDS:2 [Ambispora leptoticha]